MTPTEFWEAAAQWGSYMTSGDPGACMYGFDERGVVQSEAHRQQCIAWLENDCRDAVDDNDDPDDRDDNHDQIDELLRYLRTAKVG